MPHCVREGSFMSYPDLVVSEACRWLRVGKAEDLDVAHRLLTGCPSGPRHVYAQQSAEKALKAALVLEGRIRLSDPRLRDALNLGATVGGTTKKLPPDLAELTEWAVEYRGIRANGRQATEVEETRAET